MYPACSYQMRPLLLEYRKQIEGLYGRNTLSKYPVEGLLGTSGLQTCFHPLQRHTSPKTLSGNLNMQTLQIAETEHSQLTDLPTGTFLQKLGFLALLTNQEHRSLFGRIAFDVAQR